MDPKQSGRDCGMSSGFKWTRGRSRAGLRGDEARYRRGLRLITATVKINLIMWIARVSVRDMMAL